MTDERSSGERRRHRRMSVSLGADGRLLRPEEVEQMLQALSEPKIVTLSASTGRSARLATINISIGGMCAVGSLEDLGEKMPEVDERVFLAVELPDGEKPLNAMGRVVWVINAGEKNGRLGLAFVKFEQEGEARLQKFLDD